MRKPEFVSAEQAVRMIKDGSTVATIGMTLISASETILKQIEKSFLETGSPRNLTLVHSCGQSDRDRGIQHFAHEGLMTKIIGGHWGLQHQSDEDDCLQPGQGVLLSTGPVCAAFQEHGGRRAG